MENEKKIKNRYLLSKWISYIFEAPFLAIPTFIIINLLLDINNFLIIESICLFFGTILPIIVLLLWGKIKKVDMDYTIKESRNYPLLIAIFLYFLGTFVLWLFSANPLVIALMFCYASNTLLVFFVNLKWKISVHSMGIAGPTTALMFINPYFFVLGLIGQLVMWSRITLKKHTVGQVLAGSAFGYFLTAIQIYYLTRLMNFDLSYDIYLTLLIIFGLILPPIILAFTCYLNDKSAFGSYSYIRIMFICMLVGSILVFSIFFSAIPTLVLLLSWSSSILISYFGGLSCSKVRL